MKIAEVVARGLPPEIEPLYAARGITVLSSPQIAAVHAGVLDRKSVLVAAPTSSGKTLVGEMASVRRAGDGLTIYLVSHKALARQVFDLFAQRYLVSGAPFLRVGLLTGDQDTVLGHWSDFQVVVATYEKLYGTLLADRRPLTRITTVIADEVQIVAEEGRGPTVELLLAVRHRRLDDDELGVVLFRAVELAKKRLDGVEGPARQPALDEVVVRSVQARPRPSPARSKPSSATPRSASRPGPRTSSPGSTPKAARPRPGGSVSARTCPPAAASASLRSRTARASTTSFRSSTIACGSATAS